jgi:hypothetical protein
MSALLENTLEDVDILEGATIEKVWITEPDLEYEYPAVRLRVRYRNGSLVNNSPTGEYEIWQDVEGNGPGYIAFVENSV